MPTLPDKTYKATNFKPKCYARAICTQFREKYGLELYPVCPLLKKMTTNTPLYNLQPFANVPSPLLKTILKVLVFCRNVMQLKPNIETVVRCAHSGDFLKNQIDPVRNDLATLSLWLEKDYPATSKECKKLVAELQLAETRYTWNSGGFIYLLPPDPEHGNWATYLQWRYLKVNLSLPQISQPQNEMMRLTNSFPAEAIKVSHNIYDQLNPLAKIVSEQLSFDIQLSSIQTPIDNMGDETNSQATPETDSTLIYQADAATFYNIPKSILSKAANKKSGEPGYLWSNTKGSRRFYRKKDIEKISRSRQKLKNI